MNLTLRKMALLEMCLAEKENLTKIQGHATITISQELKEKVTKLMDQVRQ